MNGVLLVLILVVVAAIGLAVWSSSRASGNRNAASLADAKADARRVIERLGGQVLNLNGTNEASTQALADASERFTAASSQIDQATTAKQAMLAKESALEGLYYVRAARTAMGMDPGPELETISGQKSAGAVTEDRRVQFEGREIEASPVPTDTHPELLPGRPGRRPSGAGRLVLRAVVEDRLWSPVRGAWARCCCSTRCSPGMGGVGYDASGFENGYGSGFDQGFDQGYDQGLDAGQDGGGDGGGWGGDGGGWGDAVTAGTAAAVAAAAAVGLRRLRRR